MDYSGTREKLIQEKNLKSKFSCQTPFIRMRKKILSMLSINTGDVDIVESNQIFFSVWATIGHPLWSPRDRGMCDSCVTIHNH